MGGKRERRESHMAEGVRTKRWQFNEEAFTKKNKKNKQRTRGSGKRETERDERQRALEGVGRKSDTVFLENHIFLSQQRQAATNIYFCYVQEHALLFGDNTETDTDFFSVNADLWFSLMRAMNLAAVCASHTFGDTAFSTIQLVGHSRVQYAAHSTMHKRHGTQYTIHNTHYSAQYTVHSTQHTVDSTYTVRSTQ
jgi:hypothetical protein